MCVCNWLTLLCSRNLYDIANQLYSRKILKNLRDLGFGNRFFFFSLISTPDPTTLPAPGNEFLDMPPVAWETSKQKIKKFSAQVAATKCHGLGSFNKRNSFLTAPEAGSLGQSVSTVKVWWKFSYWPAESCLLTMSSKERKRKEGRRKREKNKRSGISSYEHIHLTMRALPSRPHLDVIISWRPHHVILSY